MAGLKINICAIHKFPKASLENTIIENYLKRMPWSVNIQQLELKDKFPPEKQKINEGELLSKAILPGSFVLVLDENGSQFTSQEFSLKINKIIQPICFIIGGAYGLSDEIKKRADLLLSLSSMTMPHIFARIILVEQLYRAYSISQNHPYHK